MKRIVILSMIIFAVTFSALVVFAKNTIVGEKQVTTMDLQEEIMFHTQEWDNQLGSSNSTKEKQTNVEETTEKETRPESNETAEEVLARLMLIDSKYLQSYQTESEEYKIIGTIKIDKIGLQYDILSDTSTNLLKVSLNRYWGPTKVNTVGNMCIVGHNYKNLTHFGKLNELVLGDEIEIIDPYGVGLTYEVYDKFIADPYDTRCTSQLTDGRTEITLITCYQHGTQRMIIKAKAKEKNNTTLQEFIENIIQ